jgi:hypothetical protein
LRARAGDALRRWRCRAEVGERDLRIAHGTVAALRRALGAVGWHWEAGALRMDTDTRASGKVVAQVDVMSGKRLRGVRNISR